MLMEGLQCPAGNYSGDIGWWLPDMFEDGKLYMVIEDLPYVGEGSEY